MIAIILYYYTYLIIYREKTKQEEGKEEREPGRRMPPPSSPVPRLSSVPSAASTVHTIASRSPLRPLVSALREMDGRPPRPLLVDVIATPRHHIATERPAAGQLLDGLTSCPPRPLPRPSLLSVALHCPRPHPFFPSVFVCGSCYSSP